MDSEILERLQASLPQGTNLEIPPKCFVDMQGELLDYAPGRSLTVRFPVLERYQNPYGMMQGGLIVAAIDNTIGPLSLLVGPPSVTAHLNVAYIRPVAPEDGHITVVGTVDEQTRRMLFLKAEVNNPAGKLVALCHTSFSVIQPAA